VAELEASVRYMVIERYRHGSSPVYARFAKSGRMLPRGLVYIDSWVEAPRLDRCFQLMETDDAGLFEEWASSWNDLVEFEIVPVLTSAEAAARVTAR
jgi:hypothetical protein